MIHEVPMLDEQQITNFQQTVWDYYTEFGRHDMLWRQPQADGSFDTYQIMVSEIMLQQTQVSRVTPKYETFLAQFPTIDTLAKASLSEVLKAWSGLGYNRRAKFLWQAARQVHEQCSGTMPHTVAGLTGLPGIGPNTAGAIAAYAYNQPVSFLETNIRTVYIHHFCQDQTGVSDKLLMGFVEQTLPAQHSLVPSVREWYWALMDYGSYLKQTVGNLNKLSKNYSKQSTFKGSTRQLRGTVLRVLGQQPMTLNMLSEQLPDERLATVVESLLSEAMISRNGDHFHLG